MKQTLMAPLLAMMLLLISHSVAADPMAPPGPPGPVFKNLGEIEPRAALGGQQAASPILIDSPGSYYLTGPVTAVPGHPAISINADQVLLDLNGFTVTGDANSEDGHGIHVSGRQVTILNGTVRDAGGSGITCADGSSLVLLEIAAVDNGDNGAGCPQLRVAGGEFSDNGGIGLVSLNLHATGVRANNNGHIGLSMSSGSMVTRSMANSNGFAGVNCAQGTSLVTQTIAKSNGQLNRLGCQVFDSEIPL